MTTTSDHPLTGVFARREALAAGITARVLEGPRFRRVHRGVYCHVSQELTFDEQVEAARLALPAGAATTGLTRIQQLGLDWGPRSPLRFVVQSDYHAHLDGVFLHRTVLMPPAEDGCVAPVAAFLSFCHGARMIDAISVGSWLAHRGHLTRDGLVDLALAQPWRAGAAEALLVVEWLDDRCRSLPEAELLGLERATGLPLPEVNVTLDPESIHPVTPDQWWQEFEAAVEYEGGQHQDDRDQYLSDIDRYAAYRRAGVRYVQVTREMMRRPRLVMAKVDALLREGGYDGPPPDFGEIWESLFRPLHRLVPRRRR